MSESAARISVVIVTYNSKNLIDRCLRPLLEDQNGTFEIVVWDNDSADGTAGYVRTLYETVTVIASDKNLGFAGGNNAAFAYCHAPYVALLNPDAFLPSAMVLNELVDRLETMPDIGMIAPRLINQDGSHQVGDSGWSPTALTVIAHSFFLHRLCGRFPSLYLTNPGLLAKPLVEVDWVCGACLVTRRTIIDEVGGLNNEIFMYGEDVEWGGRVRSLGHKVMYVPTLSVLHLQGATQRDEAELFRSTKWLDNLILRVTRPMSLLDRVIIVISLIAGFLLRGALYGIIGCLSGSARRIGRARIMFSYAKHVVFLALSSPPPPEAKA
jgi:GT2 family glycosyltransferase